MLGLFVFFGNLFLVGSWFLKLKPPPVLRGEGGCQLRLGNALEQAPQEQTTHDDTGDREARGDGGTERGGDGDADIVERVREVREDNRGVRLLAGGSGTDADDDGSGDDLGTLDDEVADAFARVAKLGFDVVEQVHDVFLCFFVIPQTPNPQ